MSDISQTSFNFITIFVDKKCIAIYLNFIGGDSNCIFLSIHDEMLNNYQFIQF